MLPPLEEHGLADELEPRGKLQRGILKHLLELISRHVLGSLDFVLVDVEIDVGLDEEDVIDCTPLVSIAVSGDVGVVCGGRPGGEIGVGCFSLSCSPHLPSLGAL